MRNPFWRLKTLPWSPLIQNAALTVVLATVLDLILIFTLTLLLNIWPQGSLLLLQGGTVQILLAFLAAGGVGALAVILMERVFRNVLLDATTLWALIGCLTVVLFLKSLLPIPALLVGLSYIQFVGLIFGLFSQGRGYWR
ncbi:peptide chain release factor 1 [Oscillatoria sp. CS-180]|uniref:peptide chain release factor 1 n=1 Tax=Oscillatoria sp. CS-180 TaxID=3021720 RepID=UPI00232EC0BD|nr:peptide chain release factor 1 [Oscillatoria sp. CS-180]MDB9525968.1 peptide chain release factor 1 [Oscillatoria sp. CS-180]